MSAHHLQVRHVAIRAAQAVLLLWLVTSLTFLLLRLAPGDPATLLSSPTATAAELDATRARLGLNRSISAQYGQWMRTMLRGEWGVSLATERPVADTVRAALPVSLFLGVVSLTASFLVGIAIGAWQALRASRVADVGVTVVGTALLAMPSFWLALALVVLATSVAATVNAPAWLRLPAFGVTAPGLPVGGVSTAARIADLTRHALLPLLVLVIPGAAGVARYARQALRDARASPGVFAAAARGVPRPRIDRRYVVRNAVTPLVVLLGLMFPGVLAGSVFVEQVFAWPGIGRAMLSSIAARDYPVLLVLTLLYAAAVIVANLAADTALVWLDPRQRTARRAA